MMSLRGSTAAVRSVLVRRSTTTSRLSSRQYFSSSSARPRNANSFTVLVPATAVGVGAIAYALSDAEAQSSLKTLLSPDVAQCSAGGAAKGGEVVMYGPTAEPATGILFPRLCNGLTYVGCGVRVKYRFVKVYAVGTYVDPIAMDYVKKQGDEEITKALLDPQFPRTIRVVMNRSLSIEKYTAAIVEALEPRMNGEDLDKLEEFKKLNPKGDLVEGAVMEMTVRGDTLLYRNSAGSVGAIHSQVFCKAMCDVYYGEDAVSPPHKEDVIKGIKAL